MHRNCQSYKQQTYTGNMRMPSWYTLAYPQPLAATPLPMTQHPLSINLKHFFASKRFNELNEVKVRRPGNYSSYIANSILNGLKPAASYTPSISTKLIIYMNGQYWIPAKAVISYLLNHQYSTKLLPKIQSTSDYQMDPRSNRHILLSWTIHTYQPQRVRVILSLDLLLTPLFQLSGSVTQDVRSLLPSLALGSKSDTETASFGQEKNVREQACGWYH